MLKSLKRWIRNWAEEEEITEEDVIEALENHNNNIKILDHNCIMLGQQFTFLERRIVRLESLLDQSDPDWREKAVRINN